MKTKRSYHEPGDVVLAAWQEQIEQAQEKPWLAALLLRQGERILHRFAYFYERLRALPRNTRRTIQKKLAATLAGAALLLALSGTPSVHASSITVDGTTCTLADAITAANTNTATGGCIAGDDSGGYDAIDLQTDVTLGAALPQINSAIVLEANNHFIDGAGSFRVLDVILGGDLTLRNATISGGSSADGAGINNYRGTVTVQYSTISGNTGGGIGSFGGLLTVQNSTISGNSTFGLGSSLGVVDGTVIVQNSTISGNLNRGINCYRTTITLENVTVANNSGDFGISLFNAGGTVRNSIMYNPAVTTAECGGGFLLTSNGYNIEGDTSCNFTGTGDSQSTNPMIGALADNGGPTQTHALTSSSLAAIDAIANGVNGCVSGTSVDQRGAVRADGVNRGGTGCDIGAFEYASTQTPTAITMTGLTARGEGISSPVTVGTAGVLALLTGGWLAHIRRRRV